MSEPATKLPQPTATAVVETGVTTNRVRLRRNARKPSTNGYKVIGISIYSDDLDKADGIVRRLKQSGFGRASLSWLIRVAIDSLDVDEVERSARRFR